MDASADPKSEMSMRVLRFAPVRLALLGYYRVSGTQDWHILLAGMATALATGVFEELVFRGALFRLAEEWFASWATLQGLVPISTWAGLLLVATYLLTGGLWLGIGLHAAWNYTQGTVYSGIVSGNAPPEGFLKSTLRGPEWLTGGAFGVEASAVAVLLCGTAGLVMLVKAVRLGRMKPPAWKRGA